MRRVQPIPRRAVLRGLGGTALGLPLLDIMQPKKAHAAIPNRLLVVFFPNGTVGSDDGTRLYPTGDGADYQLAKEWSALERHRADIHILKNIYNHPADLGEFPNHPRAGSCWLTCVEINKSYTEIRAGISMDQVVANQIGEQTPIPSLALANGGPVSAPNEGYSPVYYQSISWRSEEEPATRFEQPSVLFDRLFGSVAETDNGERRQLQRSVLDFARGETTRLQSRLGQQDQAKLDEYLTGIREVERIIDSGLDGADCAAPGGLEPAADDLPFSQKIDVMSRMSLRALQCDKTRVITYMLDTARSNRSGDYIDVVGAHHSISHHKNQSEQQEKLMLFNQFYADAFAQLLDQMKAIDEGGSSLLDNSMVLWGSGLGDGNSHSKEHLPLVVAGRGGGLNPGRCLALPSKTPLANLHLTLIRKMGVQADSFGDSQGTLDI